MEVGRVRIIARKEEHVRVVIFGCGRVGARLARELSETHRIAVIDRAVGAFDRLGDNFAGDVIVGNGIDVDVLQRAGVAEADLFLALTNGDNRNLMAAQIATLLGARRAIVRVYDPVRAEIFRRAGLFTISPTVQAARRLAALASGEVLES